METIRFKLVTPERVLLERDLISLTCQTEMGQITILPHHSPLIATLVSGELIARTEKEEFAAHVAGGFVEVHTDGSVSLLADAAEHAEEIDVARAQEAAERAKKLMEQVRHNDVQFAEAAGALERSLARLRVARKKRHHGRAINIEEPR